MKYRPLVLLLTSLTLIGCANSGESSSSSSPPQTDEEYFQALGEKLLSMEGKINKSKSSLKRLIRYMGGLDMYVEDEYTTTRYANGDSYVKEKIGTSAIDDESETSYQEQVFDNGKKFYQIRVYDGSERTQKSAKYAESSVESIYSVGQAYTEISNFNYMLKMAKDDSVVYSFTNKEGLIENGKLSYSYSLSFYEDGDSDSEDRVLAQCMAYENVFTIENGLITHLSQKYQSDVYLGDATQSLVVNLEEDYEHGEYASFSGTLFTIGKDTD